MSGFVITGAERNAFEPLQDGSEQLHDREAQNATAMVFDCWIELDNYLQSSKGREERKNELPMT